MNTPTHLTNDFFLKFVYYKLNGNDLDLIINTAIHLLYIQLKQIIRRRAEPDLHL